MQVERSAAAIKVEAEARAWVETTLRGTAMDSIEEARLRLLKRGGEVSRTEWAEIVDRVVGDYIGAPELQRAFVHAAIVRVLTTAMALLESEVIEPHHRVAAGRLALEAEKQLAALVGVAQPQRVEVEVTVTESPADRLSSILDKVEATIIEAQAIEARAGIDTGEPVL